MTTLWQDIRYGAGMLLKNKGITLIVSIALALGIGANSAIFSVVNAVLLRPLPYAESERLVLLNEKSPVLDEMSISYPNFEDWRSQTQTFEKIGVYNRASYNLTGAGEAERIVTGQVSADLFTVLRVNALHGRVFNNDEDKPGGTPVIVLSYPLWQRRFGGQTSILNQPITLNGKSYDVIGIMPETFLYPSRRDVGPGGPTLGSAELEESWQSSGFVWRRQAQARRDARTGGCRHEHDRGEPRKAISRHEHRHPCETASVDGNICQRRAARVVGDLRGRRICAADCVREHC